MEDYRIKMSMIITIQLLFSKIDGEEQEHRISFEKLNGMDYKQLHSYREKLIVEYNDIIEARKFGAEMIYKRR